MKYCRQRINFGTYSIPCGDTHGGEEKLQCDRCMTDELKARIELLEKQLEEKK